MGFSMPNSMDDCLYFTRRTLDNDGRVIAWAERKLCPKCKKAKMGKPNDDGHVKVRAKEYVCPGCGYTESKEVHEPTCEVKIIYTCPKCTFSGETTVPYKRKKIDGVDAFIFECEKCHLKIPITKKMKAPKKKKGKEVIPDDD